MAKISTLQPTSKHNEKQPETPRQHVIKALLNFSKSLEVIQSKSIKNIEFVGN
jgi:hypothetical protein